MEHILVKKNFKHVVTVKSFDGALEELSPVSELSQNDIKGLLLGLKELHSAGITVCDIKVGRSADGQIKLTDLSTFGYQDSDPINTRYNLPEPKYVKYKSDIWCMGCFIMGKNIPKRFTKTQELLNLYIKDSSEYLKHLIVLDPNGRNLDFIKEESHDGCIIH